MKPIWSESHRPTTLEGYVFKNKEHTEQIKGWLDDGCLPHVLLSGKSGTGKTTLAFLMLKLLNVNECDILYINASVDNGVEYIRDKVVGFSETMPYGDMKYVVLDESDFLSTNSQAALRGIMQDYSETTRFILTCNYVSRIMDGVVSRCQQMIINSVDLNEFTLRVAEILVAENVTFDLDILDDYVKKTYPDMRKCINNIQGHSTGGVLSKLSDDLKNDNDTFFEMAKIFKSGKIKAARQFVADNIPLGQYVDAYRFLYDNVDLFVDGEQAENDAIIIIKCGLVDHACIADPEMCLSATITQLSMVRT